METNSGPIVVEQTYNVPVAVVWKAITDKDQMRQWFFEQITEFKPESGFETEFNVHNEGRDFLHVWKITEVVPERRIACGWRYGGFPGDSTVVWELSETTDGTRLTLTHTGGETFSGDIPEFSREACRGGWEYFLQQSLMGFLEAHG